MKKEIIYSALVTPDGTLLESLHRHDYKTHTDKNGKEYIIDGGTDYIRCSANGDETFLTIYSDDPFTHIRQYAYRLGYGKPGNPDYGTFRKTVFCNMTDEHLEASINYIGVRKGSLHHQLLIKEKEYRQENNISIKETE